MRVTPDVGLIKSPHDDIHSLPGQRPTSVIHGVFVHAFDKFAEQFTKAPAAPTTWKAMESARVMGSLHTSLLIL